MSDLMYRIRGDAHLSHAYVSKFATRSKYTVYNPERRRERYKKTKEILGRTGTKEAREKNPYGNYKSPYYDPVYRHNYYEAHKDHVTRPYGTGGSGKSSGSGRGGGKGSGRGSGKGSGGGGKGSSKGQAANMAAQIKKLREESALETEAQREATKRKIDDLRNQLASQVEKLRGDTYDATQKEKNLAEIRGLTQGLRAKIKNLQGKNEAEIKQESERLKKWISNEKDALERRIAAIYSTYGKKYTPRTQAAQTKASKARDKDVKSRADSLYKSKTKKK